MATKKSRNSGGNSHNKTSTRILIGLLVGAAIGVVFNLWGETPAREWILKNLVNPVGQAFLQSLFMVVVPLVFSSLAVGVANLGSAGHVGRLGGRLGLYYVATTLIAILIGQFLVAVIQPGTGISETYISQARSGFTEQISGLMQKSTGVKESLWPGLVTTIIPKNIVGAMAAPNMLAIIFVAILFGIALLSVEKDKSDPTLKVLSAISECSIRVVQWIMKFAPFAVAALMIGAVSKFGLELMGNVALYMVVVFLGYVLHMFGTYSLIMKYLVRLPLKEFYRRGFPAIATAFSTSSSNATLPTTIETLEDRLGVPESITTFSVPLGATVNMDGTALFEVVAALFVAQVFGVELTLMNHITLVIMVLLTSIGVAGVPGGSIPILMSAMATMGIPPEGIALVIGVDRLLDMGRTTVNVTGDMTAALYLSRIEKVPLEARMKALG